MKKLVFITFLTLSFSLILSAQITTEQSDAVFEDISAEQRAKLVERLNLFIQLEASGKFDDSYKMIAESFKERIRDGFNRKDYEKASKVKKFVPQSLTVMSEDTIYTAVPVKIDKLAVFITGCGKFKSDSGKLETLIEAYWENNDWYFSFMQPVGFQPSRCKYKIKKKK